MEAFPNQYQAFLESVVIGHMISDFQDKKSQYNVIDHLDDQVIEFVPEDGVTRSASCAQITTPAINLRPVLNTHTSSSIHDAGNALLHLYGPNVKPLGWQENMNLMMIKQEKVAEALYVPPVGECEVNSLHAFNSGDPVNHQTIIDKNNCMGRPSGFRVMKDHFCPDSNTGVLPAKEYTAYGRRKKKQTVQCVSESGIEAYAHLSCQKQPLKKSKTLLCKSSPCPNCSKDHEEYPNPKCDMRRAEPAELLPTIVQEEAKAESQNDCIYVIARRDQATGSHNLAERARREKIRKRFKFLQELVPGCNEITGQARILEEIINYVQHLQKQVEILSMMLATGVPFCDYNIK